MCFFLYFKDIYPIDGRARFFYVFYAGGGGYTGGRCTGSSALILAKRAANGTPGSINPLGGAFLSRDDDFSTYGNP